MLITMFTDASYCSQSKIGAFAIWAKTDGQTIRHSGVLKNPVQGSDDAEVQALVNGFHRVCQTWQQPGMLIIAQSDSTNAIGALQRGFANRRACPVTVEAVKLFVEMKSKYGFRTDFRHVKGHRGTSTPRNAVNTWCDRECRRLMREARAARGEVAA